MSPRSRAAPLGGERRGVTDVVCVLLPTLLALLLALSVAPPPVAASPTEQGVAEKAEAADAQKNCTKKVSTDCPDLSLKSYPPAGHKRDSIDIDIELIDLNDTDSDSNDSVVDFVENKALGANDTDGYGGSDEGSATPTSEMQAEPVTEQET